MNRLILGGRLVGRALGRGSGAHQGPGGDAALDQLHLHLVAGFVGGPAAWDLARAGEAATIAFAREQLAALLGAKAAAAAGVNAGAKPVCSGPYKFVEWVRSDRIVLEKVPSFKLRPANFERVVWRVIPEASTRTAELARQVGVPITSLDDAKWLDLTIDGADEFDANLALIKGGGAALLQEKIVATASDQMIVITDAAKEVAQHV